MKICLFSASLEQGGAERVMSVLANEFVQLGHDVVIITLVDRPIFFDLDKRIKVSCLNFENSGPVQRILNQLKTVKSLKDFLLSEKPDVLLSFMVKYNILAILAAKNTGVKVFVSDRSNPLKELPFVQSFLRKKLYPKATGIISQTSLAKKVMEDIVGPINNIKIILNPIPSFIKENLPKEKIIISVGRLVKLKGHDYLLRAFSKSMQKGWRLVILGEGPEMDNLKNIANQLNISDKVTLPGAVKNVNSWLEKSSIFAFTSSSEGFPNALAEAMVAGLPCISFDCNAGPRDLINKENGFLIPEGDENLLAKNLKDLMLNDDLRTTIGKKAQEIAKTLNNSAISKEYLNFFEGHD